MYQPRLHEWVMCEEQILSLNYSPLDAQSTDGWFTINLEADSDARLPKGAKVVNMTCATRDSGSASTSTAGIRFASIAGGLGIQVWLLCTGAFANAWIWNIDNLILSLAGDYYAYHYATGANTLDILQINYKAVMVN